MAIQDHVVQTKKAEYLCWYLEKDRIKLEPDRV